MGKRWLQELIPCKSETFQPEENLFSMGPILRVAFVISFVSIIFVSVASVSESAQPVPVVLELFTSEGCSSCPPADRLFFELQQKGVLGNAELILLGEHVDYWNDLGWKDRFSTRQFSNRQSEYARAFQLSGPYTPQVVVDGRDELVGNDSIALKNAIVAAAKRSKLVKVVLNKDAAGQLAIKVENASAKSRVFLAVTEDGLTTRVDGGENGGRTLSHAAVVRELRELQRPENGTMNISVTLPSVSDTHGRKNVVVFVQQQNLVIAGAAKIPLEAL
jgi:hypothetical protein